MFFFVMLVSASISVSVLVMVCSPVMKSNAEQQLVELSMAMDQLEEKGGFTVDEIVSIVNNSAYSLSVVDKNDSRVHDHFADIVHKGYYVSSEGVVPNATIISQVYDKFGQKKIIVQIFVQINERRSILPLFFVAFLRYPHIIYLFNKPCRGWRPRQPAFWTLHLVIYCTNFEKTLKLW